MAAKLVKWSAIKNITNSAGKSIVVAYADETSDSPSGFPSPDAKEDFAKAAEQNMAQIPADAAIVAMKESEHQSNLDQRLHDTAFCQDENGKDLPTQHFVLQK